MKYGGLRRFSFRWWLALPFSLGDIWKRLSSRDRSIHGMSYWWYGELERRAVEHVLKASGGATYRVANAGRRDPTTSVTIFELNCLLMALHEAAATRVVEIGTFNGNTALNLALNLPPDGEVVTIDLPLEEEDHDPTLAIDEGMKNMTDRRIVGEQFIDSPVAGKIRQVFCDTGKLEWQTLGGPFDLAFIDGCHAYEYVKSDTEGILEVMRPGGIVLWHDYAEMDSVSRAVDEFRGRFDDLCAIQGTRLAFGRVKS